MRELAVSHYSCCTLDVLAHALHTVHHPHNRSFIKTWRSLDYLKEWLLSGPRIDKLIEVEVEAFFFLAVSIGDSVSLFNLYKFLTSLFKESESLIERLTYGFDARLRLGSCLDVRYQDGEERDTLLISEFVEHPGVQELGGDDLISGLYLVSDPPLGLHVHLPVEVAVLHEYLDLRDVVVHLLSPRRTHLLPVVVVVTLQLLQRPAQAQVMVPEFTLVRLGHHRHTFEEPRSLLVVQVAGRRNLVLREVKSQVKEGVAHSHKGLVWEHAMLV